MADPTRLEIVPILARADGELAGPAFGLTQPKATLSEQIQVLRERGLIHVRRPGKMHHARLCVVEIEAACSGLLRTVLAAAEDAPATPTKSRNVHRARRSSRARDAGP